MFKSKQGFAVRKLAFAFFFSLKIQTRYHSQENDLQSKQNVV